MKSLLYTICLLLAANTPMHVAAKTAITNNSTATVTVKHLFSELLDPYLVIKDALVNEDMQKAQDASQKLLLAINNMPKTGLSEDFHTAFLKAQKTLVSQAEKINKSKNIAQQRTAFAELSQSLIPLAKAAKMDGPIYYQNCPMYAQGKGGNWLSLDKAIKNPLYGKKMLGCGSTVETIQTNK